MRLPKDQGARFLLALAIFTVGFGGVAIAIEGFSPPGDEEPAQIAPDEIKDPGSDACQGLMEAFNSSRRDDSILAEHGLVTDEMPAQLAQRGIRSLSCLADNLAGRVEMILLSIGDETETGVLLVPHKSTPMSSVVAYADSIADGFVPISSPAIGEGIVVRIKPGQEASRLADDLSADGNVVAIWDTVLDAKD